MDVPQGMRNSLTLLFFLFAAACQDAERRYYSNEVLIPILRDLQYAKAATYNLTSPTGDSVYQDLKLQVCLLHGVSADSLDHDLNLLLQDPVDLDLLFQKVIDSLETTSTEQPAAY